MPEREFSMASIQGLLMQYKARPRAVIKAVKGWIENERRKNDALSLGERIEPPWVMYECQLRVKIESCKYKVGDIY